MSLQFVIGNSGSGKTTEVLKRVIEQAMEEPAGHFFVIVPEQFTMQTQKDVVKLHPFHSVMNIEIVSFLRLAYRIFGELGTEVCDVLGDTGKNLILRHVAEDISDDLLVLRNGMKKAGYINELRSFMSELSQYGIDEEGLLEIRNAEGFSGRFRQKISDIEKLYKGFNDFISGNYITTEEILGRLTEVADQSALLKDSVVVLDGFTGFTPVQNQFLSKLLVLAKKVYVTATMDNRESHLSGAEEQELFYMTKKMTGSLIKLCDENHVPVDEAVVLPAPRDRRFINSDRLFYLEQNLFRDLNSYRKSEHLIGKVATENPTSVSEGSGAAGLRNNPSSGDQISLYRLEDIHDEMEFIASKILKEVRQNGRRFHDFAVICPSVDTYSYTVESAFDKYSIPLFIDQKSTITGHPFLSMIKRLFLLLQYDFRADDVLKYIKCGMDIVPGDQLDDFDYYISTISPRGYKTYKNPFKRRNKIFTEDALAKINEEKDIFMLPLVPFVEAVKGNDNSVRDISRELKELFERMDIENKLSSKAIMYRETGKEDLARQYESIYGLVNNLLDQMDTLLGDHQIKTADYLKIIDAGFDTLEVGMIPQDNDSVIFGDIERTRLNNIKVLFLCGASDGQIPKNDTRGGILSELEREKLKSEGFELAPTGRERAFRQRFYIYLALTKPSEKLIITSPKIDGEGKSARPSYLYQEIENIFPDIKVPAENGSLEADRIVNLKTKRESLIKLLNKKVSENISPNEESLLGILLKNENESDREFLGEVLKNLFFRHVPEKLKDAAHSRLIGEKVKGSVSKLESYAGCPYNYFLRYIVGLEEWKKDQLDGIDMGNYYHYVLKRYSDKIHDRNISWHDITDGDMTSILEKSMDEVALEENMQRFEEDPGSAYRFNELKNTLRTTVPLITRQVRESRFEPEGFEVDFMDVKRDLGKLDSLIYPLDKGVMEFNGKIDRLDTYTSDDGKVMVKITDYKSGKKELDPAMTFGGLDIQMFVYMDAALEMMEKKTGREAVPAGVFYVHVTSDTISANDTVMPDVAEETAESGIYSSVASQGLINSDDNIPEYLNEKVSKTGKKVPLDSSKWELLREKVRSVITEEGNHMISGDVDCKPYRSGASSACSYCPYHSICHFDVRTEGYEYREIKPAGNFVIEEN